MPKKIGGERIYFGDPRKELDLRVWMMLSSGYWSTMTMDMRLYKGVTRRIYQHGGATVHYSFWVKRKSFREHGHRLL